MDTSTGLKLFFATLTSVFLAELGDKTQLATLALSSGASGARARLYVFLGASLALVMTSALGVLGGAWLARFVRPAMMQRAAGVLFVVLGVIMLLRRPE
jgi:putative Ca2+/H+ antiporter (TMEM165/GDT1 family)